MQGLRVLLIDDEPTLRQTFTYALQYEGFHVWAAEDGDQGLQFFREFSPHIVVSDILMPHVDGFTAIDTMHAEDPSVLIIAISGATGPVGQLQAERCGARVFLRKPVEIDRLVGEIAALAQAIAPSFI